MSAGRVDRLRARYRAAVPLVLRQQISWLRAAPRAAVLHSSVLARNSRGRAFQDALRPRRSPTPATDRPPDQPSPLTALVLDDVDLVERRARRQHTTESRFSFLAAHLESRHDSDLNRCSAAHLRAMHERFASEPFEGRTVLDVGAGTQNPFGLLVLLVLLGAERAIGLEPEPVADELVAARTAAMTVAWLLSAPAMVLGENEVPTALVARRAAELDVERLWRGDLGAFDGSRVQLVARPLGSTGLPDASVDLTISNSALEHLDRPTEQLADLARVTRPGGRGCHALDASDHRRYVIDGMDELAFLTLETDRALVHGTNRLRPHELATAFEQAGFVVDELRPTDSTEMTERRRRCFVEPYRSMPLDRLAVTQALLRTHRPAHAEP